MRTPRRIFNFSFFPERRACSCQLRFWINLLSHEAFSPYMILLIRKDLAQEKSEYPVGMSVPLSPDLGGYYFISNEIGAEPDHMQVSRSLQWRYREGSRKLKK